MHEPELLILGLCVGLPALTVVARLLDVPYPIVLVLGAFPLGFIPGVPDVELDPRLVLVIFLPPLLYVIFLAYCVVLFTLVVQGLTLPGLIRRLGVVDDGREEEAEEHAARIAAADAALEALDRLEDADWTRPDTVERLRGLHAFRRQRFATLRGDVDDDGVIDRSLAYQRLLRELIEAQRVALLSLRDEGRISADTMRRVESDLDLEESRLEI